MNDGAVNVTWGGGSEMVIELDDDPNDEDRLWVPISPWRKDAMVVWQVLARRKWVWIHCFAHSLMSPGSRCPCWHQANEPRGSQHDAASSDGEGATPHYWGMVSFNDSM